MVEENIAKNTEQDIKLIEKSALFIGDEEGILVVVDIECDSKVTNAEIIYDGKNTVILNRDNKDYFALKNIPPSIREDIKSSEFVTVVEKLKGDIYSYEVSVRIVPDMGIPDDWDQCAFKIIEEMEKRLSAQNFEKFRQLINTETSK